MDRRERIRQLLQTSSARLNAHVDNLLRDPVIKAAVQREQNPNRQHPKEDEAVPKGSSRKLA
jgi:hypothetical protein